MPDPTNAAIEALLKQIAALGEEEHDLLIKRIKESLKVCEMCLMRGRCYCDPYAHYGDDI